ncbi:acyltransferase family protein [Aureibaculum luteum]|uniref:acyltransferase family protein n=1 Tax=Aureibaculum luteum TaxID=1548456 RepID=UPI000E48C376|nr:acyltransferase family protein [Aureibaculum luteum]
MTQRIKGNFGKDISTMLKGLLAVGIVLHHLAEKTNVIFIIDFFKYLGSPIVSIFFFISGYGLLNSLLIKKSNYLNTFLKKRFTTLLTPFLLAIFTFQICAYIDNQSININLIFKNLITGNTDSLLPFSWYIFTIIFFYSIFYIVFKTKQGALLYGIFIILFLSITYVIVLKYFNYGDWWYLSTFGFITGFFIKYFENLIDKKMLNFKYILLIVVIILLLIPILGVYSYLSMCLYPIATFLFLKQFYFPRNKSLLFLGKISYEIYLIQGLSIFFLRGNHIFITNDYLYIILTIIITIPLAIILNWFSKIIIKKLV